MGIVGNSEVRVDAFDKATGRTKYYEDLMPRDALYVRIKHSTIAHGFVKSVDTTAAEAIPGVVKVLTCFDVPEHPFPTAGHPWSMDPDHQDVADRHLLNRHVRYYGDDVAVVIAENEVAAMQGVRALQVEYEELPLVLDAQEAMKPGAPRLHDDYPDNVLKHTDMKKGDYQAAIREPGLIRVEGWYDTPTVQHCHIENHGCFAYEENGVIRQYPGGYSDYLAARPEPVQVKEARAEKAPVTPYRTKKVKFTFKEQREFEMIDADIAEAEAKIAQLDQAMEQAQADYVALQELTAQKEEAEANLEHLMERWVYLNDLYEQMQDEQNG